MKFFTNRIPTNNNGSFSDLVKKVAGSEQQVKTASADIAEENKIVEAETEATEVVEAEATETVEADVETETEVVEAEAAETKVVEAEAGVDDEGEGKRTDVHHGEGSANDQNGEAEEDGENKTVDPAGLGSSAEAEEEVKVADSKVGEGEGDDGDNLEGKNTGRFPDGFEPKQEAEDEGKADVEAAAEDAQVKEAGELPDALKEHQFGKKEDSDGNPDADGKDDAAEKEGCGGKMASEDPILKKVANMTAKEKSWFKDYLRRYYPESYAEAMTQDK